MTKFCTNFISWYYLPFVFEITSARREPTKSVFFISSSVINVSQINTQQHKDQFLIETAFHLRDNEFVSNIEMGLWWLRVFATCYKVPFACHCHICSKVSLLFFYVVRYGNYFSYLIRVQAFPVRVTQDRRNDCVGFGFEPLHTYSPK